MASSPVPSARHGELLEAAYRYALTHGLTDLSLRPLAAAIGSSPRVLLYLFESKDGLVRALLARARDEQLAVLDRLRDDHAGADLAEVLPRIWDWLSDPAHRELLALWLEAYARSLTDPNGAWAGFAHRTVDDWLALLAQFQPATARDTAAGAASRTAALALLRGGLLDLLATGDVTRVDAAIRLQLAHFKQR